MFRLLRQISAYKSRAQRYQRIHGSVCHGNHLSTSVGDQCFNTLFCLRVPNAQIGNGSPSTTLIHYQQLQSASTTNVQTGSVSASGLQVVTSQTPSLAIHQQIRLQSLQIPTGQAALEPMVSAGPTSVAAPGTLDTKWSGFNMGTFTVPHPPATTGDQQQQPQFLEVRFPFPSFAIMALTSKPSLSGQGYSPLVSVFNWSLGVNSWNRGSTRSIATFRIKASLFGPSGGYVKMAKTERMQ
ncbi:hypothetical protein OUZ56_023505 [Daphnia magna]|uniref:Uncharacterized protein n=1 Tax=Daphnia magna TaxID=35525 RepID=A0ABR0AZ82_9CRUS|nr:hypothetical protein OUZ56_023505 [Daphnia magna]